jgi:hypothetical protein
LLLGGASFKTCFNSCFIFLFQYFNIEHCPDFCCFSFFNLQIVSLVFQVNCYFIFVS